MSKINLATYQKSLDMTAIQRRTLSSYFYEGTQGTIVRHLGIEIKKYCSG